MSYRVFLIVCSAALIAACQSSTDYEVCVPSPTPLTFAGVDFTGHMLTVELITDYANHPALSMSLDDAGKQKLETVTGENLGEAMALNIDGEVVSAPVVQEVIRGGELMVSGALDRAEFVEIAAKLSRTCE
ncbi:MAG: SecDF P1 head subdomain-containing protein [Hyphomonas sp.]